MSRSIASRPISDLFRHEVRIYVYCSTDSVKRLFARDLSEQGYHYGDGMSPEKRGVDKIMCVHPDHTVSFCGVVCLMQCGSLKDPVYVDEDCYDGATRVDYERFTRREERYVIEGKRHVGEKTGATVEFW